MRKDKEYKILTIQALMMHHEIFFGGGISRDTFDDLYLNGIGDYERKVAEEEGLEIDT